MSPMRFSKPSAPLLLAALLLAASSLISGANPAAAQDFEDFGGFGEFESMLGPPPALVWGGVEYLLWQRRGMSTPPLVTSGDPANPSAGILDPAVAPETQILVGNDRLGERFRSGGRVNLGLWFGPYENIGVEGNYYMLG